MDLSLAIVLVSLTSVNAAGKWANIDLVYDYTDGFNKGLGPIDRYYIRGEIKACESIEVYLKEENSWSNYVLYQIYFYSSYTALLDGESYKTWEYGQVLDCNAWKPFWFMWQNGVHSMGFGLEPGTDVYLTYDIGRIFTINVVVLATGSSSATGESRWLYDEPPLFNAPLPAGNEILEISEDTGQYTVVFTPTGSDPNDDIIEFSTIGDYSDKFAVYYGVLYTMVTLDYETQNTYFLTFQADDGRYQTKNGLTIKITNVIDVTPVVTVYSIFIPEELEVGTDIGKVVSIVDEEEDDTMTISWAGTNDQYLNFDTTTYIMTVAQRMDIDAGYIDFSGIYILGMDSVYNYDYKYIDIIVYDINDNEPQFTSEYYNVALNEGTASGTHLMTVAATDIDIENLGFDTYLVSENGATSGFSFSLTNFDLYVAATIDYDALESVNFEYVLVLMVVDNPNYGGLLSSTAVVRVKINPVNEAAPAWTSTGSYTASVAEDSPLTTVLVTIGATDTDLGPDGKITYSIQSVSPCKVSRGLQQLQWRLILDFEM